MTTTPDTRPLAGLTAAEHKISILVADGHGNDEIASALAVSRKTVEWHLTNVYRKLGVRSRTRLAIAVLAHGGGAPASSNPGEKP